MALTESTMLPLGTPAPGFSLPDAVTGRLTGFDDVAGERATLIMFICNHCPYVQHVLDGIVALARDYRQRGVGVAAINANDAERYPEDAPDRMKAMAEARGFPFPYLFDESQAVARAYRAACTPDFFVFDRDRRCVYRGQMDGARPGNDVPVTGENLRAALDAVIAGEPVTVEQRPSMGCNIKWK